MSAIFNYRKTMPTDKKKDNKNHEKYESDDTDSDDSSENNTSESEDTISGPKYIYIGVPEGNFKKLYEEKNAENQKLLAEIAKYQTALKEETQKSSEADDLVKIMKTTKYAESKIKTLKENNKVKETVVETQKENKNQKMAGPMQAKLQDLRVTTNTIQILGKKKKILLTVLPVIKRFILRKLRST